MPLIQDDPRACCTCPCHSDELAEYHETKLYGALWKGITDSALSAFQKLKRAGYGAATNDPLEAAVACDICRKKHCPALSSIPERPETTEWIDVGFPPPATGCDESGG